MHGKIGTLAWPVACGPPVARGRTMASTRSFFRGACAIAALLGAFPVLRRARADQCPATRSVVAESVELERVSIDTFSAAKGAVVLTVSATSRTEPVLLWIWFDQAARTAPAFRCSLAPSSLTGGTSSIGALCDCGGSDAGDDRCAELTIPRSDDPGDYVRVDLAAVAGQITIATVGDPFVAGTVTVSIDVPATSVVDDRGEAHSLEIRGLVGRQQEALVEPSCPESGGCDCVGPGGGWRPGGG